MPIMNGSKIYTEAAESAMFIHGGLVEEHCMGDTSRTERSDSGPLQVIMPE